MPYRSIFNDDEDITGPLKPYGFILIAISKAGFQSNTCCFLLFINAALHSNHRFNLATFKFSGFLLLWDTPSVSDSHK